MDKVQAIAHKEGFTIRSFMEYVMKQGYRGLWVQAWKGEENQVERNSWGDVAMWISSHVYVWTCTHVDMNTYRHEYIYMCGRENIVQNISNQ